MFQRLEQELTGYKLFDYGSWYELHSSHGVFRGNLHQVRTYAVMELGFKFKEIDYGVLAMEENFHNGAEFGVRKSFLYTFDAKEKYAKSIITH